jgi:hypothetical protein
MLVVNCVNSSHNKGFAQVTWQWAAGAQGHAETLVELFTQGFEQVTWVWAAATQGQPETLVELFTQGF